MELFSIHCGEKIDYMNIDVGNGFDSTEDDFNAESSTGSFDEGYNWIDQSVQNGEIVNGSEKEDARHLVLMRMETILLM